MADRAAGISSGKAKAPDASYSLGAGGGFQTPFGFGFEFNADSGFVVDKNLNFATQLGQECLQI